MQPTWSIHICDAASNSVLFEEAPDAMMRTASVGKVLLLITAAMLIETGELDPAERLHRRAEDAVADSGIWQRLSVDALPITDLCELVGAASDNLATNALLRRIGLEAVTLTATHYGLHQTVLLDRVRDRRGPQHPWTLSTGTATELAHLLSQLSRDHTGGRSPSNRVWGWLANGLDLSMVAAGWGLDPLAHSASDRGLMLRHKTGTDDGVRCDVGVLSGPARSVAYAVLANWDPDGPDERDAVLDRMRHFGLQIRAWAR